MWTKKERMENARQPVRQPLAWSTTLYPRPVVGVGKGDRGRHTRVGRRWSVRGTPWLGSRRGVVITSRSDRVPLLSRRHTLAEKQNGTSDRPTDRPTLLPSPFSLLSLLSLIFSPLAHPLSLPPVPHPFLSFSPLTLRFLFDFLVIWTCTKYSQEDYRHVAEQREKRGRTNY